MNEANTPSKWVRAGGIRDDMFVVLDVSHLPEERFVHKLIGRTNHIVRILYLREGFSLLLTDTNPWGMHEVLLCRMSPYSHSYHKHSQHHKYWCKLPPHSQPADKK